jgi:hypothetical protein
MFLYRRKMYVLSRIIFHSKTRLVTAPEIHD